MKEKSSSPDHNRSGRFKEADWYTPGLNVTLGGAGGIGSYVAFFLSRQEAIITLYEFDTIEEHNLGGQLYPVNSIGKLKSDAIQDLCNNFSRQGMYLMGEFTEHSHVRPITISAFDNMKARKLMFEQWKKLENRELFIDGRMNAEQGQIYYVTKGKEEDYEKTLFDDKDVEELPCSYKATSHCGGIMASLIIAGLNNYIANKKTESDMRELPFHVHYILQMFQFNVS